MEKQISAKHKKLCKKYGVDPELVPEIHSFEAACKDREIDPKKLPIVKGIEKRHQKRIIADYKLSIIAEAIRGGKTADYTNINEDKWYVRFLVKADAKRPSGFGLSYYDYGLWYSNAHVGVRLCFPHWDQAKFFGMQFMDLHIDHQLYT